MILIALMIQKNVFNKAGIYTFSGLILPIPVVVVVPNENTFYSLQ